MAEARGAGIWRNLPIRLKLLAMPGVAFLACCFILGTSLLGSVQDRDLQREIATRRIPALELSRSLGEILGRVQRQFQDAVAAENPLGLAAADELRDEFLALLSSENAKDALDGELVGRLRRDFQAYYDLARTASAAMIEHKEGEGLLGSLERMQKSQLVLRKSIENLSDESKERMSAAFAQVEANNVKSLRFMVVVTALALALLVGLSFAMTRSIRMPLERAVHVARELAQGNLDVTVEDSGARDEAGQLLSAMRDMVESLSKLIAEIRMSSGNLMSAATQISASSAGLATGASRQSELSREIATSAEETAASVQVISENTGRVQEASQKTQRIAGDGGEVVKQTGGHLNSIAGIVGSATRQIDDLSNLAGDICRIVDVIREIASQTRLLALNAAIEAARAGEHGRGFEVVATEVGNLAQKSANSVGQIASQLQAIEERVKTVQGAMVSVREVVEKGNSLGSQLSGALGQILEAALGTNTLLAALTQATTEQAASSDQAARQVATIADLAVEGASGAEEMAATAGELAKLAQVLEKTVAKFRLS